MAMLGKRFQRTISMSEIGPASNLHAEKPQAHHLQQQQRVLEEQQPVDQWDILKNAEAMMMMMMANSGANTTAISSEEGPLLQERQAQTGRYPRASPASSTSGAQEHQYMSSPMIPTHHFLDACFYCKRRLRPERDIFIYRGDAAFCTEECRQRQILSDETHPPRASKKGGAASETAVAA